MKKDRKNQKRLTSNVVVRFFWREHISPRTSKTAVRVQVVGVCEVHTLAGKLKPGLDHDRDSLSCWTRLALANEKEGNVEERLKQLYSRSQLAPTNSVKDKSNSVVCQKKTFRR